MISDRIKKIRSSPTVQLAAKAIALKEAGEDIIDFSVGEPDFPTPEYIKRAAIEALAHNATKYTENSGLLELRRAVCKKLKKENNLLFSPEQVLISSGAKHALFNVLLSIIGKEDEVIIPAPYWGSYPEIVRLAEGIPVFAKTQESNGFHLTAKELERKITLRTRAFILCNPVNPTGAAYAEDQLKELAAVLRDRDIFIISDEIYEKLLFDEMLFYSFAEILPSAKDRLIIINGLSKAFAMTGWRIGYAAGPREIVAAAAKLQSHSTSAASTVSQYAAIAALEGPQTEMKQMVLEFQLRRDFIVEKLNAIPGISCNKPQGAFYVFPNISSFFGKTYKGSIIKDSIGFGKFLLEEAKTVVVPGSGFGAEGYVRISYSTSLQNIQKGIRRISDALARL